jgi:hypothetical protein
VTERTDTRTARPAGIRSWRVSSSFRGALVVAFLVAAASVATSRPAAASCPSTECAATSIANAEVAFVGTVLSTASRDRVARVRVEEVWKGRALPEQVEVRGTSSQGQGSPATSGDRSFRLGVRYLFVPHGGSASPAANGLPIFTDGACTATQEYHPNLDRLRPASDASARTSVHTDAPASTEGHPVPVLPLAVGVAAAVAVGAVLGAVARHSYKLDR